MHERVPTYEIVSRSVEKPIVLYGPPNRLRGALDIANPGEEKVTLRRASLSGDFLPAGAVTQRMSTLRVRPTEAAQFDLDFDLGPHTPPGRYVGSIEVAGAVRPAEVTITEVHDLDISPDYLVITGAPGSTISKEVVVHNRGNVDAEMPSSMGLPLDDDLRDCRVLRQATAKVSEQDETSLDDLLKILADVGQQVLDDAGILRARIGGGKGPVAAGEIRALSCSFTLPKTLRFGSRYRARLPLGAQVVHVLVVPQRGNGDQPTDQANDQPTDRPTDRRPQSSRPPKSKKAPSLPESSPPNASSPPI